MGERDPEREQGAGELFRFFVVQNQMTAMIYLGKMVHPATGEIERNLEGARLSIDLLGMLEEKTRGNLTPDEAKLLEQVLTNLRLNFVDEMRKEQEARTAEKAPGSGGQESSAAEKETDKTAAESAEKTGKTANEHVGQEGQSEPGGGGSEGAAGSR